jgi:hypothetical protein
VKHIDLTRILFVAATIAVAAAAFTACKKGNSKSDASFSHDREVYVVGFEITPDIARVATLWRSGVTFHLGSEGSLSEANSVHVAGTDVYVVGFEEIAPGTSIAMLWLNEQAHYLSNGFQNDKANSVFVWGDHVYIAGVENGAATVWADGIPQRLGEAESEAMSVFVSDGEVFVAGWEESVPGTRFAMLWVNGVGRRLSGGGPHDEAASVQVLGSTVFVAGTSEKHKMSVATLWKNYVPIQLGENGVSSYANCVQVLGSKVYVALNQRGFAQISTNGTRALVSKKSSKINSVSVSGGDVYAAGTMGGNATVWRNNSPRQMNNINSSRGAEAKSIFLR